MKPFTRLFLLIGMGLVLLAGCQRTPTATRTEPAGGAYWPTADWRSASPAEEGMDAAKLAEMQAAIQQKGLGLHSLLIVRHGYLVSETYYAGYQRGTKHELYSCTKSFVSTLVGMALDKGKIRGLEQKVVDFFPEERFANLTAEKQAMTLEDALTMRTGLDWQEEDAAYRDLYVSADWVKYMLDRPMAQAPGTHFNYCSGCSHLLSAIVQQSTGMQTLDFAQKYLFEPLGIQDLTWDTDSRGTPIGGWGLQLTPREMAKLGYLFLHQGQWDGKQVVSAGWVETATKPHTPGDGSLGYGYQWWTYPALEGYTALGRYGQTIFVVPGSDLVIVTTAQMEDHDEIFKLIEEYIVPAAQISS
jgi:CubicO group peptidase (beta-lactamase class C family)